jgi:hypothetical protein
MDMATYCVWTGRVQYGPRDEMIGIYWKKRSCHKRLRVAKKIARGRALPTGLEEESLVRLCKGANFCEALPRRKGKRPDESRFKMSDIPF